MVYINSQNEAFIYSSSMIAKKKNIDNIIISS